MRTFLELLGCISARLFLLFISLQVYFDSHNKERISFTRRWSELGWLPHLEIPAEFSTVTISSSVFHLKIFTELALDSSDFRNHLFEMFLCQHFLVVDLGSIFSYA